MYDFYLIWDSPCPPLFIIPHAVVTYFLNRREVAPTQRPRRTPQGASREDRRLSMLEHSLTELGSQRSKSLPGSAGPRRSLSCASLAALGTGRIGVRRSSSHGCGSTGLWASAPQSLPSDVPQDQPGSVEEKSSAAIDLFELGDSHSAPALGVDASLYDAAVSDAAADPGASLLGDRARWVAVEALAHTADICRDLEICRDAPTEVRTGSLSVSLRFGHALRFQPAVKQGPARRLGVDVSLPLEAAGEVARSPSPSSSPSPRDSLQLPALTSLVAVALSGLGILGTGLPSLATGLQSRLSRSAPRSAESSGPLPTSTELAAGLLASPGGSKRFRLRRNVSCLSTRHVSPLAAGSEGRPEAAGASEPGSSTAEAPAGEQQGMRAMHASGRGNISRSVL